VKSIEDIDKNRLNLLRADRGLTPVYEAVMWLRENKNKFRAPIHEPPLISVRLHKHFFKDTFQKAFYTFFLFLLLQLSVKDTKMAKYVENSIGFNDMKAFYCENKDDSNFPFRYLTFYFC
jgi:hypothetical protein